MLIPRWRMVSVTSIKRAIVVPGLCFVALLFILHLHNITTYPAQLIPEIDYYPTLRSSLSAFPVSMHAALEDALAVPLLPTTIHRMPSSPNTDSPSSSSPGLTTGNTSLIPNSVFQTDRKPPLSRDARSWDTNGFKRVFLNDADALAWVVEHFGSSDVTRTYRALPKPVM